MSIRGGGRILIECFSVQTTDNSDVYRGAMDGHGIYITQDMVAVVKRTRPTDIIATFSSPSIN